MKYFIDTEFIEGFHKPMFGKRRHFIDLISIGIYAEDGREYYAISNEWNYKDASPWVRENVIKKLDSEADLKYKSNGRIADEARTFFGCWRDQHFWRAKEGIEVYGYYSDYDWVVFCSLFGRMIDLPKGFPMYCKDLKQMLDEKVSGYNNNDFLTEFHKLEPISFESKLKLVKNGSSYPQQESEHNALDDAKWNYELYKFLTK